MENHIVFQLYDDWNKIESKLSADMLFSDFFIYWLDRHKVRVQENTYNSYCLQAKAHIIPYFREKAITVSGLDGETIESYYSYKLSQGLSRSTVMHHHTNIHSSLDFAVRHHLISYNPSNQITIPKKEFFKGQFYSTNELFACLAAFRGHSLELCVLFAALMGLRRSEILGLTWRDICIPEHTVTIRSTLVISINPNTGKKYLIHKQRTKNQSSLRTLVLPQIIEQKLTEYLDHHIVRPEQPVCLKPDGSKISPAFLTPNFKKCLIHSGLRVIRFHDLRHSCATILHKNGYDIRDIQMWLGHSDITTTAKFYAHFNLEDKKRVASGLDKIMDQYQ